MENRLLIAIFLSLLIHEILTKPAATKEDSSNMTNYTGGQHSATQSPIISSFTDTLTYYQQGISSTPELNYPYLESSKTTTNPTTTTAKPLLRNVVFLIGMAALAVVLVITVLVICACRGSCAIASNNRYKSNNSYGSINVG